MRTRPSLAALVLGLAISALVHTGASAEIVGGRPPGCPARFCGCGTSLEHFGRIVPGLNLARAWLRFPRTSAAPGMVGVRPHHVLTLREHVRGDIWMVKDYNSGGGKTRYHARSIRGYVIVNPQGGHHVGL